MPDKLLSSFVTPTTQSGFMKLIGKDRYLAFVVVIPKEGGLPEMRVQSAAVAPSKSGSSVNYPAAYKSMSQGVFGLIGYGKLVYPPAANSVTIKADRDVEAYVKQYLKWLSDVEKIKN
jgi:hypothetical protein